MAEISGRFQFNINDKHRFFLLLLFCPTSAVIKLSASYKVFVLLDFSLSMRSFPCFGSLDKSVFSKCGWGRGIPFGIFFFTFYKGSTVYWKLGYLVRISVMLYKMCLTILLHWISSYCYWLHSVTAWSCSLGTWYSAVHSFNEAEVSSVVCGEHRCDHSIWHTQIEQQYDWPVSGGEAGRADQICYSGTLFSVSSPRLCSRTTLKAPKMQFYKCILFGLSYSAGVLMVACRIAFVEFFFFFLEGGGEVGIKKLCFCCLM